MRKIWHVVVAAGVCLPAPVFGDDGPVRVEQVYQMHCASCHGDRFQGGMGGSLVDGNWKYGSRDEEILQSISVGNPDLGMEAFGESLTREEIRALVVYLREREVEFARKQITPPKPHGDRVVQTRHHAYRIEKVADGFEVPWALAFLPDGRMLVTERPGPLRIVEPDGRVGPPVEGTPAVIAHGQGGMMEVAVHPNYQSNRWIYLGYADGERKDGVSTLTAIVRGRISANKWVDEQTIWRADRKHYTGTGVHFGTRIVFRDGYLFFAIGDRGNMKLAQDLATPQGNIFRLHEDGRVPPNNPFVGRRDALPEIWSYGHRNPQGLAFHPLTGDLYSTEHGPRGGDEFNLILPGLNYGWPVITRGIKYNGTPITAQTEMEGMEQPLVDWTPSIAACGLTALAGDAFPLWKGDFFAGGLRAEELHRVRVHDRVVVEEELVLKGIGRIRDVREGPDGLLYLVLNDPHEIVRMVPAASP